MQKVTKETGLEPCMILDALHLLIVLSETELDLFSTVGRTTQLYLNPHNLCVASLLHLGHKQISSNHGHNISVLSFNDTSCTST